MMALVTRKKRKAYQAGVRVYFFDEAPRIGSGWRIVIAKQGRKWVRVTEVSTGRAARIETAIWLRMLAPHLPIVKTGKGKS